VTTYLTTKSGDLLARLSSLARQLRGGAACDPHSPSPLSSCTPSIITRLLRLLDRALHAPAALLRAHWARLAGPHPVAADVASIGAPHPAPAPPRRSPPSVESWRSAAPSMWAVPQRTGHAHTRRGSSSRR
jgi:hypothetical protein